MPEALSPDECGSRPTRGRPHYSACDSLHTTVLMSGCVLRGRFVKRPCGVCIGMEHDFATGRRGRRPLRKSSGSIGKGESGTRIRNQIEPPGSIWKGESRAWIWKRRAGFLTKTKSSPPARFGKEDRGNGYGAGAHWLSPLRGCAVE